MYEIRRQHPFIIVHAFSSYILLLLLPLLRSLTLLQDGVWGWAAGVWQDVLVLFAILLFGWLRWRRETYQLLDKGMACQLGLIFQQERYLPYQTLTSVTVEHPWYLRVLRIVRVRLETDAGSRREPDLTLLLRLRDADRLTDVACRHLQPNRTTRSYRPNPLSVAFLSLVTSDSLTGVLFAATLISQTGKLLGKEIEDRVLTSLTRLMELLAFGLPPLAAVIALTILGGWLLDFLSNLVRHLGFQAVRDGERLTVRNGIFTLREYQLSVNKINFLQLRQSLLTLMLGYCAVMINCTGYGKEKNEMAVLLPAANKAELDHSLRLILPEIRPGYGRGWHSAKDVLSRYLIPPLSLLGAMLAVLGLCWWKLPGLHRLLFFLGLMAILPAVWWLFVKIGAFLYNGIEMRGRTCTFRTVWGYAFYTTVTGCDKIVRVELRWSLFQRMRKCCDVVIHLRCEKGRKITVKDIPRADAEDFLESFSRFGAG